LSALTGEVIADLVMGRKPAFDLTPYSPHRFSQDGASEMNSEVRVLALIRDLFFRSKLDALADQVGATIVYASTLEAAAAQIARAAPTIAMVDLNDTSFPADRTLVALRAAAPGLRVVGFASHVDLKALKSARTAGFSETLSRSEFTAKLPLLLRD
jgi:DNA-binding NarL/FixJ family response regulator